MMPAVVARATTAQKAKEIDNWVGMYSGVRTPTGELIFHPGVSGMKADVVDSNGRARPTLSGHVGALYAPNPVELKQLVRGQNPFHQRLRDAFDPPTSPADVIGRMRAIADREIWDGGATPGVRHLEPYYRSRAVANPMTVGTLGAELGPKKTTLLNAFNQWMQDYGS